jgi:hypothetical protein
MASAGLLKLLSSGLQDERLLGPKGQPLISAFQKTFLRAGRFTTEWYRVDFDNQPAFGSTAKITVPRRGHLVTRAYLVTRMPDISTTQAQARKYASDNGLQFAGPTFGWTNSIGHALLTSANITIGGAPIDTLDGRLLEVLDEFHTPLEKTTTLNRLIGRYDNGFTPKSNGFTGVQEIVTPLPFWFSRGDPSSALPIDAIGNDLVQLGASYNVVDALYTSTSRLKDPRSYVITPGSPAVASIPAQTLVKGCERVFQSGDEAKAAIPEVTGMLAMPPMAGSPFYVLDPNGEEIFGLNGNPEKSVKVRRIPGIKMPESFKIQESYILLEYVYLDKPEANRIRLADLSYPVVQHYSFKQETKGHFTTRVPLRIPNPCRDIYFMAHRVDADLLNAPFLATRDLSGANVFDISGIGLIAPWWPDAKGLSVDKFTPLIPAFSSIDSEPIQTLELLYEGKMIRYATGSPEFFRSILPTIEQRKTPWHNKYYYHLPFGTHSEAFGLSNPMGHANLDKITRIELSLTFKPFRGSIRQSDVPAYTIYVWAETYNILRVYGGRAGLLFGY